jgi:hypothetical protein
MRSISLILIVFLATIGCNQSDKNDKGQKPKPVMTSFIKGDKMDRQEFWRIIDYSFINSAGNQETQEKIISDKLLYYSLEEIKDFEVIFRQLIIEADDYKIMAAEKIIEGWVTDDPYLYFRCWLIGQGQKTFEETLKSPDYLADIISNKPDTNFEGLMYVATTAYSQKTGKDEDETFPRDSAIDKGLDYDFGAPPTKGTDWTEDQLPNLYPKLWAKFQ